MTLEEKIKHLQDASIEEARAEGNSIIRDHSDALEQLFKEHKDAAVRQAELTIKTEKNQARQNLNKALARSQTDLKRELGKLQVQLKDRIFNRVMDLIKEYMTTEEYVALLVTYIQNAMAFAKGQNMILYLNPSDADKKAALEAQTGASLTMSTRDFTGGIRAVIQERNILIDHSFQSKLSEQYDAFLFTGGISHE